MINLADLIDSGKSSDLLELVSSVSHAKQRRRRPRTRKRDPQHVPRPTNCFMIYRLEMQRHIRSYCPNANHRDISKIVAKWWHKEPLHVKEHFRAMADKAKQAHRDMYPEYKYVPKKKKPQQLKTIKSQEQQSILISSPVPTISASPLSDTPGTTDPEGACGPLLASPCGPVKDLSSCGLNHQQPDNDLEYSLYSVPPTTLVHPHHHHPLLPATGDTFGSIPMVYYGASASTSPMATPVWDSLSYVDPIVSYASLLDHSSQPQHWQPGHQHQLVLSTRSALSTTNSPIPPPLVEPLPYSYNYYPTYY